MDQVWKQESKLQIRGGCAVSPTLELVLANWRNELLFIPWSRMWYIENRFRALISGTIH